MKLDHFVVHIQNKPRILEDLKKEISSKGFPFEPSYGKGTKGFKVANIWIGRQYFEIVRLLSKNGGGWPKHWVDRYNRGTHGIYCIFLTTNNIDKIAQELRNRGCPVGDPERVTFKALFGLIKKTLPWRMLHTPAIPGTDLEVGFIQYDPDPKDSLKKYLVPNSDENGITGISSATVKLPLKPSTVDYLKKLFPSGVMSGSEFCFKLDSGYLTFSDAPQTEVSLKADVSTKHLQGNQFQLENVTVLT